jgi:lysophospholipase L1-like esterase
MKRIRPSHALLLALLLAVPPLVIGCRQATPWQVRAAAARDDVEPSANQGMAGRIELLAERARRHADAQLVFVGDSITQGWEGPGQPVWAERYGTRGALNLGVSGDRTEHVVWRLRQGHLDGLEPRVLVLMIGTNDTGAGRTPERIADGVATILDELTRGMPRTTILLLAIFPRGRQPKDPMRSNNAAANRLLQTMADGERVRWVDIGDAFLEIDGYLDEAVMPDALHLSEDGYRRWAEALEPELLRALDEGP